MHRLIAWTLAVVFTIGSLVVTFHGHAAPAARSVAAASVVGVRPASTAASRDYERPDLAKIAVAKLRQRLILAHERAVAAHKRAVAAARARARAAAAAARARARAAAAFLNSSAEAWAHSAFAVKVANCESGGSPRAVNGIYHGKWQMDPDFWRSYGGLRFASDPLYATEAQQDYVAWRGWKARGWEPWQCASMV